MSTEMQAEDLSQYSKEHKGQYNLQEVGVKLNNWRCFRLDSAELRRLEILETNTTQRNYFDKHLRLVSKITGVPAEEIDYTGLQGDILTVVPK